MRYIEDIQHIHIDLTRDDGDILVVCSLLDKLCFLMVDWVSRNNLVNERQVSEKNPSRSFHLSSSTFVSNNDMTFSSMIVNFS
jgi:hypothetical protein